MLSFDTNFFQIGYKVNLGQVSNDWIGKEVI